MPEKTKTPAKKQEPKLYQKRMPKEAIYEFFKRLHAIDPEPTSDLEWTNAYTLLVAVTLSAQATDEGVNRATKDLFPIADTPRDELVALPGVGRKTANVVLNVVFGEPTMAVDTHIFRVSNRTGMAPGKNPDKVELELLKVVPEEFGLHAHHWLILHGRYTCVARKPKCSECRVYELCNFKEKTA